MFGSPEYSVMLDSAKNEALNKNCCFPGFSTLDGTFEIAYLDDGWYRTICGAATANGGGQPHIWHVEPSLEGSVTKAVLKMDAVKQLIAR